MKKKVFSAAAVLLLSASVGAQNFSPDMKIFDGAAQTETASAAAEEVAKVGVYIASTEVSFGQESNTLEMALKSLMAADDYEFVESEAEGDYKVTLKGQTREGNDSDGNIKYSFVDVTVMVYDNAKRKVVFATQFNKVKGSETTWHLAGQNAYKNAASQVYEAIKPYLKNNKK